MIMSKRIFINYAWCMAFIIVVTSCDKEFDSAASISNQEVQIEVECPKMGSWSTEEINYTRSENSNKVLQKDETDGLDMEVCTLPDTIRRATTRWTNIDNNTVFRVVAYACSSAATITTSNYKGYGDYQLLSNGTVKTLRNITLPVGTYTFVCYSYGNSSAMSAFNNSTTTITATNGQNFMTCIRPNINIPDTGTKYTLSNITFRNRSTRYRIKVTAQSGRMDKITSCSATLSLPQKSLTYTFTNDVISPNEANGSFNVTWTNPNAMTVYSDYVYILSMNPGNITIKLNATIGGKAFTNKSVALSNLILKPNGIYCSNVSFTTTAGYIVAGAFWARGNLYLNKSNAFTFQSDTHIYSSNLSDNGYWGWNVLDPQDRATKNTSWSDSRDPCRKIAGWRSPTLAELTALKSVTYKDETRSGVKGRLFNGILFLPKCGYRWGSNGNLLENTTRGLYWGNGVTSYFLDFRDNAETITNATAANDGLSIRCVKN